MGFGGGLAFGEGVALDTPDDLLFPSLSPGAMDVCLRHLRRLVPFLDTTKVSTSIVNPE